MIEYAVFNKQQAQRVSLVPSDPESRYKAHQLLCSCLGKNKMLKTVFHNLDQAAKDMHCEPIWLLNFLAYELNVPAYAQVQGQANCSGIGGNHSGEQLSLLIQQFIESFLLCPVCGLPELKHGASKHHIRAQCHSCGTASKLALKNDKFVRFVQHHPPRSEIEAL